MGSKRFLHRCERKSDRSLHQNLAGGFFLPPTLPFSIPQLCSVRGFVQGSLGMPKSRVMFSDGAARDLLQYLADALELMSRLPPFDEKAAHPADNLASFVILAGLSRRTFLDLRENHYGRYLLVGGWFVTHYCTVQMPLLVFSSFCSGGWDCHAVRTSKKVMTLQRFANHVF